MKQLKMILRRLLILNSDILEASILEKEFMVPTLSRSRDGYSAKVNYNSSYLFINR